MEWLSSRFIFSTLCGAGFLTLGIIALVKGPHKRINRFFAAYSFFSAARFIMPGLMVEFMSHSQALIGYRVVQFLFPMYGYFLLCFVQEYAGIYNQTGPRRLRALTIGAIAILLPFYPSSLVIRDFVFDRSNDVPFTILAGPIYPVHNAIFLLLFGAAVVTTFRQLRSTSGVMRNQLLFIALAMLLGVGAHFFQVLSRMFTDMPWTYFSLSLAMNFTFAYVIFKHQLFDFDLWMRRVAIFSGVYLSLISLPALAFFPFRSQLMASGYAIWPVLCVAVILYGILFALAPMAITYLRMRAEKELWLHLRSQLQFLKEASDTLSAEDQLSHREITVRVTEALREFYWDRLKRPLSFIVAAIVDHSGRVHFTTHPESHVEIEVLKSFFNSLQSIPASVLPIPFSLLDVDRRLQDSDAAPLKADLQVLRNYLAGNAIELCAPCAHDGKFYGALLVGAKTKGIFMEEEMTTLLAMAAHTAMAARKSELIFSNQQLEKLDDMKHELISNITHEFKSPVQVVENAVQILLSDVQKGTLNPDRVTQYLMMIRNNNGRLGLFIQNLLDVAKIENAAVHLKPAMVELGSLLRETVGLYKPTLEKKGLQISIEAPEPVRAWVDVEKIRQVFTNLVSNAIKFTDHGFIRISLEKKEGEVLIAIRDSGHGISKEELPSLFQKFFQSSDSNKTNAEGTGLGLAIAKGWVEAHKGRIWAESEGQGQGTAFFVQLPTRFQETAEEDWQEEAFG